MRHTYRLYNEFGVAGRHLLAQLRAALVYRTLEPKDRRLGMLILNGSLWAPEFAYVPYSNKERNLNRWGNEAVVNIKSRTQGMKASRTT